MRLFCYTTFTVDDNNKLLFLRVLQRLSDQYPTISYFEKDGCYGFTIEGKINPEIVVPQLEKLIKSYNNQIMLNGAVSGISEDNFEAYGIKNLFTLSAEQISVIEQAAKIVASPAYTQFLQIIMAAFDTVRSKYAQIWKKIEAAKQEELAAELKELEDKIGAIKRQGNSSYHDDSFGFGGTPHHSSSSFNQFSSPSYSGSNNSFGLQNFPTSYSNSQFSIDSSQTQQKQKIEQQNQKIMRDLELSSIKTEKSNAKLRTESSLQFTKVDLDSALQKEIELITAFFSKVTEKFNSKEIFDEQLASIWSTELLIKGQTLQPQQVNVIEAATRNGNVTFALSASNLIKLNLWLNQNPKLEVDAELFIAALEKSMGMRPKQISYDHQKQQLTFEINCNVTSGSEPYFIQDIQKVLFSAGLAVDYFVSSVNFAIEPAQVKTVTLESKPAEVKQPIDKEEVLKGITQQFFSQTPINSGWVKVSSLGDQVRVLPLPNQFMNAGPQLASLLKQTGFFAQAIQNPDTGQYGVSVDLKKSKPTTPSNTQ